MTQQYTRFDEKPYDSGYLIFETTIEYPLARVWPKVLDIGSWMSDYGLVTLEGQSGEVGHFQRVFPQGIADSVPQPHHHYYGVAEIVPFRLIALETFREKGGSYGKSGDGMNFDCILLTDVGDATKVTFLIIDIANGDKERPQQSRTPKDDHAGTPDRLERYFDNLRNLVRHGDIPL